MYRCVTNQPCFPASDTHCIQHALTCSRDKFVSEWVIHVITCQSLHIRYNAIRMVLPHIPAFSSTSARPPATNNPPSFSDLGGSRSIAQRTDTHPRTWRCSVSRMIDSRHRRSLARYKVRVLPLFTIPQRKISRLKDDPKDSIPQSFPDWTVAETCA